MSEEITAKKAIEKAKWIVEDMFSDEKPQDIGLEEIRTEDDGDVWVVIIGFSRPWDQPINRYAPSIRATLTDVFPRRSFKVVRIDGETGKMISLTDYEFETKKSSS